MTEPVRIHTIGEYVWRWGARVADGVWYEPWFVEKIGPKRVIAWLFDDSRLYLRRTSLERYGQAYSRLGTFYTERPADSCLTLVDLTEGETVNALGLKRPFTAQELRTAYRRRARETHPDHGGSTEEFRRVYVAYEALRMSLR